MRSCAPESVRTQHSGRRLRSGLDDAKNCSDRGLLLACVLLRTTVMVGSQES